MVFCIKKRFLSLVILGLQRYLNLYDTLNALIVCIIYVDGVDGVFSIQNKF